MKGFIIESLALLASQQQKWRLGFIRNENIKLNLIQNTIL